jgi:hypothetical protein
VIASDFFEDIRRRPGMWLPAIDYDVAAAFVLGADSACYGGLLFGFREWLIVKVDGGNNLAWTELLLRLALPETIYPRQQLKQLTDQRPVVDFLFQTICDFVHERDRMDGARSIFLEYEKWLRRQDWYDPDATKRG